MNNKTRKIFFITLLLCLFVVFGQGDIVTKNLKNESNGTVLALYVIGSDLEYDAENPTPGGPASEDLKEIVTGYGEGTEGLDVIIGFGGSLKPGWQGMTIVTPEMIRDDIEDGDLSGNSSFLSRDENANMADPNTLTQFLNFVSENSPGKRILLVFWDHGGAWYGFGHDENHIDPITGSPHMLSLDEIKVSLTDADLYYDLIGFDACLMASLEVASTVAPFSKILVASEDNEPGFGWDWVNILHTLVENPHIPVEDLGKVIVNSYLDNPNHIFEPKTLSVVNLDEIQDLSESFDKFSENLEEKVTDPIILDNLSAATLTVRPFGATVMKSGDTFEYTVDLLDYLKSIKRYNPSLSEEVDPIIEKVNNTVLYAREDGSRPHSNGISIYSPYNALLVSENKADRPEVQKFAGFTSFLEKMILELKKDTRKIPEIIEDRSGYTVPENSTVTVELTYIMYTNSSMIVLGTEPAYPDKPGHYPHPKWGGWAIQWQNSDTGESLEVPATFFGYTTTGKEWYKAYGIVTRDGFSKNLQFDFYFEPHTGEITYYITPYTQVGKRPVYERKVWKMLPGDILTMMATHRLAGSGSERFDEYGSITWTETTDIGYGMLPCGHKYSIIFDVRDVTRKIIYHYYNDIDVPCLNETESSDSL